MTSDRKPKPCDLAPFLNALKSRYNRPELLASDPLALVHQFPYRDDREIAALFAALLAYGNVKQINRSLDRLFAAMNHAPARFIREFDHRHACAALGGFKHRFTDAEDILCLCWLLHQTLKTHSLQDVFCLGYRAEEPDLALAAGRFIVHLQARDFCPHFNRSRMLAKSSFKHLMPRADAGSACKRIHLFLRWMIRESDGVDMCLWTRIPPSKLLVPVDTHILRIGRNLGVITARQTSLRAAREITKALRAVAHDDPVQFDFALCRLGILKLCPKASEITVCRSCELHDPCLKRQRLERRQISKNRTTEL